VMKDIYNIAQFVSHSKLLVHITVASVKGRFVLETGHQLNDIMCKYAVVCSELC